jgi:hypothetical protein
MASAAKQRGRVIGKRRVEAFIKRRKRKGDDSPDVLGFLDRKLGSGAALSAAVTNQAGAGKYDPPLFASRPFTGEPESDNLRRLRGLNIGKGMTYVGAFSTTTPRTERRTPNEGYSSTPETTTFTPIVLPRDMVRARGGSTAKRASADADSTPVSIEPGPDLLAAREAYDYLNSGNASSGSAASGIYQPDLTKTGGDLFSEIQAGAQSQIDDYERRFIPKLLANANLTAQEIGYAGRQAIANLPADLNLPDYDKIFPRKATDKKGIYRWLESRFV